MVRRAEPLVLLIILAGATFLRFRGIDWGLPYPYHPDEGSVLFHALGFGTGDLNPHWFRWPSLMMYGMFGVYGGYYVIGRLLGTFGAPLDLVRSYLSDLSPFWLMGRYVSAAAGVITVGVTHRLGRHSLGRSVGLVSALFLPVLNVVSRTAVLNRTRKLQKARDALVAKGFDEKLSVVRSVVLQESSNSSELFRGSNHAVARSPSSISRRTCL